MSRLLDLNYRLFLQMSDVVLTLICLALARLARLEWGLGVEIVHPKAAELSPAVFLLVVVLWVFFFNLLSIYSTHKMGNLVVELQSTAIAVLTATAAFSGVLYISFREVPRLLFIYFCTFDLIALLGFRLLERVVFRVPVGFDHEMPRVLILGAGKVGRDLAHAIKARAWPVSQIVGFLDDDSGKQGESIDGVAVLGGLERVSEIVREHNIDEVVFALPLRAHHRLINLVVDLEKLPVEVKVVPDLFDLAFARTTVEEVDGMPLISLRESAINGYTRLAKRVSARTAGFSECINSARW
jgi:FlaA1/EpsC-like NDP-sugar epimerase